MIIQFTKKEQYWLFWCHVWSNHKNQEVFWESRVVEAVKASEVAEAAEVNETAELPKDQTFTTEDLGVIIYLDFFIMRTKMILLWCYDVLREFRGCWGQPILLFENCLKNIQKRSKKFNMHISICQLHFKRSISIWNTLYYDGSRPMVLFDAEWQACWVGLSSGL